MGTQTGEQRVAVVGRAVDADGAAVSGVEVEIEGEGGVVIATTVTDDNGNYSVEVVREEVLQLLTVSFTTQNGRTAAASVSTVGVTSVTVNLTLTPDGVPVVVVPPPPPTTIPTPRPTASDSDGVLEPTPTNTPVPPPAEETSTPTPGSPPPATPIPPCTVNCDAIGAPTPPADEDAVDCGPDAALTSGGQCCSKSDAYEKICCAPEYADAGLCTCVDGNC
jgi:hypothetical protein